MDGASGPRIFWQITLPMMRGPALVTILFRVMFSFNTFDTIYIMTGGGPGRSSETLLMYAYRLGFEQWHMGESAAAALIMLLLVTVLTRFILRVLRGKGARRRRSRLALEGREPLAYACSGSDGSTAWSWWLLRP